MYLNNDIRRIRDFVAFTQYALALTFLKHCMPDQGPKSIIFISSSRFTILLFKSICSMRRQKSSIPMHTFRRCFILNSLISLNHKIHHDILSDHPSGPRPESAWASPKRSSFLHHPELASPEEKL